MSHSSQLAKNHKVKEEDEDKNEDDGDEIECNETEAAETKGGVDVLALPPHPAIKKIIALDIANLIHLSVSFPLNMKQS